MKPVEPMGVLIGQALHFLDVGAGGESLVRSGDDDAANVVAGVENFQRAGDVLGQLHIERVERLGTVERDEADAAALLDQDGFISGKRKFGHGQAAFAERMKLITPEKSASPPPAATKAS